MAPRSPRSRVWPSHGQLTPLQDAFWAKHGLQCGFCTPGMVFAAHEILRTNPNPSARADPARPGGQHVPVHRAIRTSCARCRRPLPIGVRPRPEVPDDRHQRGFCSRLRLGDPQTRRSQAPDRHGALHGRLHPAGDGARRHPPQPARPRAPTRHRYEPREERAWRRRGLHGADTEAALQCIPVRLAASERRAEDFTVPRAGDRRGALRRRCRCGRRRGVRVLRPTTPSS